MENLDSPASRPSPANPSGPTAAPDSAATTAPAQAGVVGGIVSEDQVKLMLRRVKDPDLQLNIVDLGLVYGVRVDGDVVNV
ncbi:MAG: iron-sulfur cluster assembly protein, partial [Gemmatimonadaceae bacterium]